MNGNTSSYNEIERDEAYEKGRQAFREGLARNANPYPHGSYPLHEEWLHGWDQEKQLQNSANREGA